MTRGITKTKTRQLEKDIPDINLDNTLKVDHVNMFCNSLTDNLTRIVEKYTMKMKHMQEQDTALTSNNHPSRGHKNCFSCC